MQSLAASQRNNLVGWKWLVVGDEDKMVVLLLLSFFIEFLNFFFFFFSFFFFFFLFFFSSENFGVRCWVACPVLFLVVVGRPNERLTWTVGR